MTSLYDRIARTEDGSRRLASARLRHEILKLIHRAQRASGLNQVELAKKLDVRKSAVNQVLRGDGNVRINTLAEYLHATGFELTVSLVRVGEPRERVLRRRGRLATNITGAYVSLGPEAPPESPWLAAVGPLSAASPAVRRAHPVPTEQRTLPTAPMDLQRAMFEARGLQPIGTGHRR